MRERTTAHRRVAIVIAVTASLYGPIVGSAPAATSCGARVLAGVAKAATFRLRCEGIGIRTGAPATPQCLAKATRPLAASSVAACSDDGVALQQLADGVAGDVVAALTNGLSDDTRRCAARKVAAAARHAQDRLRCHALVANGQSDDPASCLTKATARLASLWDRVEAASACATHDDRDAIAARVATFVSDVLQVLTPATATVTGTYDVDYTFDPPAFVPDGIALGVLGESAQGLYLNVRFGIYDSLFASGPLGPGGTLPLQGYFIFGGDIAYLASGSATLTDDGSAWRIAGTLLIPNLQPLDGTTFSFTATRPKTGTPPSLAGTYAVTFAPSPSTPSLAGGGPPSTAAITLTVPATGRGASLLACDRDANGFAVGRLDPGTCDLSPAGRLYCFTIYRDADPGSPPGECNAVPNTETYLTLSGALGSGAGGSGQYLLGLAPAIYGQGTWSAMH